MPAGKAKGWEMLGAGEKIRGREERRGREKRKDKEGGNGGEERISRGGGKGMGEEKGYGRREGVQVTTIHLVGAWEEGRALSIRHFLLVVHWNRASISNRVRDIHPKKSCAQTDRHTKVKQYIRQCLLRSLGGYNNSFTLTLSSKFAISSHSV